MEKILSLHHRSTVEGCHQHFPGILRNTIEKYFGNTMEIQWKYNGDTMEIQWKYNGNTMEKILNLRHCSTMEECLQHFPEILRTWNEGVVDLRLRVFAQFFIVPVNPRLGASPMMCLPILALGIVTCGIIHYERDILSITWRDGPLLQIQEAGPALHLPYPPLLVLDHPRHKTTLAHFVYQLEVWAEWFCSQSRYHQTFRGPDRMEYSS